MSSGTRIVICGGGAIGAAIAYFTSRRGARSTVIERHAVAGAASGKSGGFLALDWCGGSPLDRLARRSFELHAELSAELGDPWGLSASNDLRRLRRRGRYFARCRWAAVAGRRRSDHGPARLIGDDRARRAPRVHDRSDACRSGAWSSAVTRHCRRLATQPERSSARRITRGREIVEGDAVVI